MDELFAEVREQCGPDVWSAGVQLARRDAVTGDYQGGGEVRLRVLDRQSGVGVQVELFFDDVDWNRDCSCKSDPCHHVAAAIIALKRASESGQELPRSKTASAHIGYRLTRSDRSLSFKRVLVNESSEQDLLGKLDSTSLAASATKEDLEIETSLGTERRGILASDSMIKLLRQLADVRDIKLDGQPVTIDKEPLGLIIRIEDEGPGVQVLAKPDPRIKEVFINGVALSDQGLHPSPPLKLDRSLFARLKKGLIIPKQDLANFVSSVLPHLEQTGRLEIAAKNLPKLVQGESLDLSLELIVQGRMLKVIPSIVYGSPPLAKLSHEGYVLLSREAPVRDPDRERQLQDQLWRELKLDFMKSHLMKASEAVDWLQKLNRFSGHLSGDGLQHFQLHAGLQAKTSITELGDALDFNLSFTSNDSQGQSVDSKSVFAAWEAGESYVPLLGGGYAPLPIDWLERYGPHVKALLAAKAEQGKLDKSQIPALSRLADELAIELSPALKKLCSQLEDFVDLPSFQAPLDFTAKLRDYQTQGARWLNFLKSQNLGAILADDMGLGKTVQTIAILEPASLIVAPTSVIPNWQKELQKFRPSLKVQVYHGSQRSWDPSADVVLTSYGLLRQDLDLLGSKTWKITVLDEAQTIKNADSQVSRAAFQLPAHFRICLSGTPIENRLDDLWSLMQFANPGLLGAKQFFRDEFAKPIMDDQPLVKEQLQARIKPFILRRLKKEVLPELPPRSEKILYAELSQQERAIYESILAATRQDLVDRLETGGNVIEALEALLRLRQACCHPALLPNREAESSAKLDVLSEQLSTALAEGHKALVFSQWTSFLDLIGERLSQDSISFLRLDGQSRNRGELVDQFQADDGPPVMIMSLKAGGVGLNLSRADHVFIMDPWWNPAVEDQAADRAHRIGQENPVMVHPIVAMNSVEEKILGLQQKKRALATVLGDNVAGNLITKEDLLALFD